VLTGLGVFLLPRKKAEELLTELKGKVQSEARKKEGIPRQIQGWQKKEGAWSARSPKRK